MNHVAPLTPSSDVLIVGAGPAGSFLGYLLARRGCAVTIIDKEVFPRDKVCGGGLSPKTLALLPFDPAPVVQRRVRGAFLTYQNRDTVVKDLGECGGAAVLRSEFDEWLLRHAIEAGAVFHGATAFQALERDGDGVVITTSRGVMRARYLVGADGVFSQVRRAAFGPDLVSYVPAVEALVEVTPEQAARLDDRVVFDFGSMPRGYGWIFPKRDHLNVGVYSIYPNRSIKSELARFISRYEILRAPLGVRWVGSAIPVENRRHVFENDRVLLLGDAAGLAEAFYGEGIYYALESAAIADAALAASFGRPSDRVYTELVKARIQPDLTYAALTARLFYPRQRFGFKRMARSAYVSECFAETIGGRIRPRECFYKTLFTSPYWLWSARLAPAGAPL